MTAEERKQILDLLDYERQAIVYPGVRRFHDKGVVRDVSEDGSACEIVYSRAADDEIDHIITHEIESARAAQYQLEWKVYGHDQPPCLGDRLLAAGFQAGDKEAFMVFFAGEEALVSFGDDHCDIRRVTNKADLRDYQRIIEEVRGTNCEEEIKFYGFMLENHPSNMSIYIAYVDGEPATCGRIYFHEQSKLAALFGGNTRERFRNRGLFIQVVAVRIREALGRGIARVWVDALPTSEPILRKRGFEIVTYSQPFSLLR